MNSTTPQLNLLILEDDPGLASSLKILASDFFRVFVTQKASLVPDHVFFHAALIDLHLEVVPPAASDGLLAIAKLVKKNPQLEVVAISGNLDRQLMEKSIHAGAQRFLAKPLSADEVTSVLEKISAHWNLRLMSYHNQNRAPRLIGDSPATETLRKKIAELKSEKSPVLIEGETGVGKDVVSQLLNLQEGARPYVSVNCSALTENLFESEFFGHLKGSFTGADSNKIGFAEAAHGGDLFLDEIEALPLSQQAKLLRFLESGEIRKVGAKEPQFVDVRIIAASNVPLKKLMNEKKFREDLFFRLSAHRIEITPLRERKADIAAIAANFLDLAKPKRNKALDDSALTELLGYNWPGNVRELKRVCEQLILTSALPVIRAEDVQKLLSSGPPTPSVATLSLDQTLEDFLRNQERRLIEYCLKQTKDIDKSCAILDISKSSLYKKIKDLGITYE